MIQISYIMRHTSSSLFAGPTIRERSKTKLIRKVSVGLRSRPASWGNAKEARKYWGGVVSPRGRPSRPFTAGVDIKYQVLAQSVESETSDEIQPA